MKYQRRKQMRLARIVVSAVAFTGLTALAVAFGTTVPEVAGWLGRIQFLPAAAAFAMTVFVGWIIATLIFGRVYCSTVCPLGFFQDIFARLPRLTPKAFHRRPYRWQPPMNMLRYVSLAIIVVCLVTGWALLPSIVDPYAAFNRMATTFLKPLWGEVVNLWARPEVMIPVASLTGWVIASVTFVAIGWLAAKNGRVYCNTICPVGTTLGLVSRYSIFHFDINTDRCTNCRLCEYACKAHCINLDDHTVDMSRCVVCFDCTAQCPVDAIRYTPESHQLSLPMMQKIGRVGTSVPTAMSAGGASADSFTKPNQHSNETISRPAQSDSDRGSGPQ